MTIQELVAKTHLALKDQDLSAAGDKLAVQVNVTGKDEGVFYIEILNGSLSVEPYDYHDRDCAITLSGADYSRLAGGRMNTANTISAGKLLVDGNADAFETLAALFKAAAPAKKAAKKSK